ncbi:hypothetical protein [Ralstonia pseudosolanacearum]|uniref:hypothetical protein n=1 Tax=Ralstonia pseudosolanacearum TaxID=1310165 RepID=UPI003CF82506
MNLRILKKLSKRAAPLLPLLGERRKVFIADDDCHTSTGGHDRKHWYRLRVNHGGSPLRGSIKRPTMRAGSWVVLRQPFAPWPGTPMVGDFFGYYEPEWEEETAWEALLTLVFDHFTEWSMEGPKLLRRDLDTPTRILRAAREIIAAAPNLQEERANHA